MVKYFLCPLVSVFLLISSVLHAQDYDAPHRVSEYDNTIDPEQFDAKLLTDAVLYVLNYELKKQLYQPLKPLDELYPVAQEKADAASKAGSITDVGSKYAISALFEAHGYASTGCDELLLKISARSGKEYSTYYQLGQDVVLKWLNYKKTIQVLKSGNNVYVGLGAVLDASGKAYVVAAVANYKTLNKGKAMLKESGFPISTSSQGLKPFDDRICRNVLRYPKLARHANDISVDSEGTVYFETDEYKQFKKLLREPGDGLVADIVIKKQYTICGSENIVDYQQVSKGVMLKKLMLSKLLKLNEYEGKDARYKFKVPLGSVPQGVGSYEINLLIISDKHVCASLIPYTIEETDVEYSYSIQPLADTVTALGRVNYKPVPDTFDLQFKIPFEAGATVYKDKDVAPLLDSIGKSYLVIKSAKITACSSIEGDDDVNEKLRKERAQSIKEIFVDNKIPAEKVSVATKDSWDEFYNDLKTSKYKYLARMEKQKLKDYISQRRLEAKLEPVLSKHRYAQIDMEVFNDIEGDKEQFFLAQRFNRLVSQNDTVEALRMQKFITQNLLNGTYSKSVIDLMKMPTDEKRYAGMRMNKLWLIYRMNNKPVDYYFARVVDSLYGLDPENEYIAYNKAYCDLLYVPLETEQQVQNIQQNIDNLYTSSINRQTLNPLNLEFQLKVLQAIDSISVNDQDDFSDAILERIKTIFEVKRDDWRGALNISALFVRQKDFVFAAKILEPYVSAFKVNEELLFQYISICSALPKKINSDVFANAVEKATDLDPSRLCKLFYDGKLSVQFLENPNVKKVYCKTCSRSAE